MGSDSNIVFLQFLLLRWSPCSYAPTEGSLNTVSGRNELDGRLQSQTQSSLIPMMFSPPESLLASCILRGNFAEARQVRGALVQQALVAWALPCYHKEC